MSKVWVGLDKNNIVQAWHLKDTVDAVDYVTAGGLTAHFIDYDLARKHVVSMEPVPIDEPSQPTMSEDVTDRSMLPAYRTSNAILALVDVVHQEDENGEHFTGFCEACAKFYVALNIITIEHTQANEDQ